MEHINFNFRSLFSRNKPKPFYVATAFSPPPQPYKPTLFSSLLKILTPKRSFKSASKPSKSRRVHRRIKINMTTCFPRIFITADTEEFDPVEIAKWQAEGYDVTYIPRADMHTLETLGEIIETGEKYCIIAYGSSATVALEYAMYPVGSLVALVAYYPTGLPSAFSSHSFPRRLSRILLHITDSQPFSFDASQIDCHSIKLRLYQDTKPGFAEKTTAHYEPIATGLAHSRTLAVIRDTIGPEIDLEDIWGEHLIASIVEKDANRTLDSMVKEPYINHIPTLIGGATYNDLHRFYHKFFIPDIPPSLRLRIVSRTVGSDRIVDEMVCSFKHTQEISWMLPGVKPTGRKVTIPIVFVVTVKAKKLYAQNVYWDQASVLKQIGVIDFGGLPVSGAEAAWKVLDKDAIPSNILLSGWEPPLESLPEALGSALPNDQETPVDSLHNDPEAAPVGSPSNDHEVPLDSQPNEQRTVHFFSDDRDTPTNDGSLDTLYR